jgi:hypothetical protein
VREFKRISGHPDTLPFHLSGMHAAASFDDDDSSVIIPDSDERTFDLAGF